MSPLNTANNSTANASIHDVWLRQRAELEAELLDVGSGTQASLQVAAAMERVPTRPSVEATRLAKSALPISLSQSTPSSVQQPTNLAGTIELPNATEVPNVPASLANIQQSLSAATTKQFLEHQQRLDQELTRQREAFLQEINRQRAAFEQELAARDATWITQRDREWAALQSAKEVHAAAVHRLQSDLATEQVREHEALQNWRRQAETELTDARRLFEQDRMQQHAEFSRQREAELDRLRQERAELETHARQSQTQLADARERHEQDLRLSLDIHATRMQTERAELEQQRKSWTENFRREQLVLENGRQFFEQHMSRFNEELKSAQHNIQSLPATQPMPSAAEQHAVTIPFSSKQFVASTSSIAQATATQLSQRHDSEPVLLSLDEIRERLNQIKNSQQQKVA